MINLVDLVSVLRENNINFSTGVPDSLIGQIGQALNDPNSGIKHITAVNEGAAVGLAIGSYLATGKVPLVYMQNSGLGNALNPLVSLAGPSAFSIPLLLLIGWRGEVGPDGIQIKDEPQHSVQGAITTSLLDQMEIPYLVMESTSVIREVVSYACNRAIELSLPFALLVRKGTFEELPLFERVGQNSISRRGAIEIICDLVGTKVPIIATTGMIGRELDDVRSSRQQPPIDLLCVGGMGHAVSVASGFATMSIQSVLLLDGDGSAQMHLGAQLTASASSNLIHIILNNGVHASVGGQETAAPNLEFFELAPHLGYARAYQVTNELEMRRVLQAALGGEGSCLIEVKCDFSVTSGLNRPRSQPSVNAKVFSELARSQRNDFGGDS